MKRPIPLFVVTCWLCLGMVLLLSRVARIATSYQHAGGAVAPLIPLLFLAVFTLAAWLVWKFIRLRPLARWLCVCFFAYWAISAAWGVTRIMLRADSPRPIVTLGVGMLVVVTLNIGSIVYLFTGRFRAFAVWYLQEQHRKEMRRYAEKQVEKGLKS